MTSVLWEALIILCNVILETIAFAHGNFLFGIRPDLTIAAIVALSLVSGPLKGGVYGMITGLILDMLYGTSIGITALIYFLVGLLCGVFNRKFYAENQVFPVILAFFAYLFKEACMMLKMLLTKTDFDFIALMWRYIIPGAILTSVITLPVYIIYKRVKQSQLRRMR